MINRCVIYGLGLIGGSLGLAISERKLAAHVCGVDINRANLEQALEAGAIQEIADPAEAVREADLVIMATPVGTTPKIIESFHGHLSPDAVVTDVGSTKQDVVKVADAMLGGRFVGGHPMAGAETAGFAGADAYLFENAYYLLTPTSYTKPAALDTMRQLATGLGALVLEVPPREHDLMTAAISHLPHLVAASLVAAVSGMPVGEKAMVLAAGGFRDTTRIAAGSPEMWRDIFVSNSSYVLDSLAFFRAALDEMEQALKEKDEARIYNLLNDAGLLRRSLPLKPKGYLPHLYEIVVTVPDRPGIIAMLAGLLGGAGINISEIEILRAREGYGGTIRIGFAGYDEQRRALELLKENNIKCRLKG